MSGSRGYRSGKHRGLMSESAKRGGEPREGVRGEGTKAPRRLAHDAPAGLPALRPGVASSTTPDLSRLRRRPLDLPDVRSGGRRGPRAALRHRRGAARLVKVCAGDWEWARRALERPRRHPTAPLYTGDAEPRYGSPCPTGPDCETSTSAPMTWSPTMPSDRKTLTTLATDLRRLGLNRLRRRAERRIAEATRKRWSAPSCSSTSSRRTRRQAAPQRRESTHTRPTRRSSRSPTGTGNGTAADLLLDLNGQETSRALERRLRHYTRPTLLVVDELGYLAYDRTRRRPDLPARQPTLRAPLTADHNQPAFQRWDTVFPNRLVRRQPGPPCR